MQLPMTGSWSIEVKAVRPFSIHGDQYWELLAARVDVPSTGEVTLRVPQHAAKVASQVGQKLSVSFLMGQVTSITL
jgi:hypothetical protein